MPKLKSALALSSRYAAIFLLSIFYHVDSAAGSPTNAHSVENVEVRGAEFIPEEDIRQTCGAEEGISYLEAELQEIQECLMSTGVFKSVEVVQKQQTLVIDVQELDTRPGRVDVGISYVPQDGVIGSLSFERYNLFDRTYGAIGLEYSIDVQRYNANLYRTEAFGTGLDLGMEIVGGHFEYDDRSYAEDAFRTEIFLAWFPAPSIRFEGGIGYRDYSMSNLSATASPLIVKEQVGGISSPYLRLGLKYDSLAEAQSNENNWKRFGYSVSLDQYFWNISSDYPILNTRLKARAQIPVTQNLRFLVGADAGRTFGTSGNTTRAIDRFFPGGDTFRGFAPRGIGPRDGQDLLGGNNFVTASIELQRDLGEIYRTPVRAGVFVETGAAWGLTDTLGNSIDDGFHRRSSFGLSLTFDVGNLPVAVYVAQPFEKEDGDKEQAFGLSLSSGF